LEEEIDLLEQRLAQTADSEAFAKLKEENKAMQESLIALQKSGGRSLLDAKYQSSRDEVISLRVQLADAQAEITKFSRGTGRESAGIQEYIAGLENKIADMERQLAEATANSTELETLKDEGIALQEEAAALRIELAGRSEGNSLSPAGDTEDQSLQRQVRFEMLNAFSNVLADNLTYNRRFLCDFLIFCCTVVATTFNFVNPHT